MVSRRRNSDFFHHEASTHLSRIDWPEEGKECGDPTPDSEEKKPWPAHLTVALGRLHDLLVERRREAERLAEMTARLNALEKKVVELSTIGAIVVPITTFAPEPFDLLKEIKVVVQPSGEESIATFFDANVNATGCNDTDAVDNLKDMLLSRFEYLDNLPRAKLGPAPAKQIAVLRTFIRRRT